MTIGILQGGGSIVGMDLEKLFPYSIGAQIGFGMVGFGCGVNWHFKPSYNSSFLSMQYWHQGLINSYKQSTLGPNFVYRGMKWFTFQIGIGFTLQEGPAYPMAMIQPPVIWTCAIGAYIPL
jgi:hypothetical protein